MARSSFQFHWRNDDYEDFDHFLSRLASRKRKQIRKERRRARSAVDSLEMVSGEDWTPDDLRRLDRFYRVTCYRHGGQDYLQPGFFVELKRHLPHRLRFARVQRDGETVAGALYLQTNRALYGRDWGCSVEIDCLHFETAYYAGIEHCIEQKLPLFEAGAQGEHKLLRGFMPSATYSSHWVRHAGLRDAVRRFLAEEKRALPAYMKELGQYAPYRKDDGRAAAKEDAAADPAADSSAAKEASPEFASEPPPESAPEPAVEP
jgi:predicted N-acyltransferase